MVQIHVPCPLAMRRVDVMGLHDCQSLHAWQALGMKSSAIGCFAVEGIQSPENVGINLKIPGGGDCLGVGAFYVRLWECLKR